MMRFSSLLRALDEVTGTNDKVTALRSFFSEAPEEESTLGAAFLLGMKIPRPVRSSLLREWAAAEAGLSAWLFEECYASVGDLAETISLILPEPETPVILSLAELLAALRELGSRPEAERRETLLGLWRSLARWDRFVFTKLITSGFRVGVSRALVFRALAQVHGLPEAVVAHRLMGWAGAGATSLPTLLTGENPADQHGRPYPFYLCYPLEAPLDTLGQPDEWIAEWKWDGIRAQLLNRCGAVSIWSRGEELVTDRFPELVRLGESLPSGTVLDGEILCIKDGAVQPFALLQKRINRRALTGRILSDAPVGFIAYDILEHAGEDIRDLPLGARRARLESLGELLERAGGRLSNPFALIDWDHLAELRASARSSCAEGVMVKRLSSPYRAGRKRGDWWKWKLDPYSIDAVLIYAQMGHGRRAELYTDYTFALWDGEQLVPFAKAYSGLSDEELAEITRYVRSNTIDKFGPVRSVTPSLVFEIGFEGIQRSARHRSGVAVRFPRILRWRKDKTHLEANTLGDLQALLDADTIVGSPIRTEDGSSRGADR